MRHRTFWVDDIPARDQGKEPCGHAPSEWYPTGCTRVQGHEGDHGYPNWTGRTEAQLYRNPISNHGHSLALETRTSHGGAPMTLRSRAEVERYIAWLQDCASEVFDG